ncbi:MAG: redoxin domain-containing protein [Puniceicoccales bacterium]|nr:redoxin domain-containing protein [Puniceicoccales bacterium]
MEKILLRLRALWLIALYLSLFQPAAILADEPTAQPPGIGDTAPDFTFVNFDGQEHKLSEFRGKPLILDFWATWCGPCIGEIPTLRAVHQEMKEKDFVVLSVSIDDKLETAKNYVAKNNMPWMQGHASGAWKSEPIKKYQVDGIPSIWLIDAKGLIRATDLRKEETKTAARLLLEGKLKLAPDPAVKVSGQVVDEKGAPVAGAKVVIYATRNGDIAKGLLPKSLDTKTFTTDENGVWTCAEMFAGATRIDMGGYHYDYDSGSGFFEMQEFDETTRDQFYDGKTKIVLRHGIRVSGVVKDGQGNPVPNIPVLLGGIEDSMNSILPRKTDAQGAFTYTVEENSYKVSFGVNIKGYAPELKTVTLAEARKGVEIILKPPQTIKGIVVDEQGNPLGNVWICLDGWRDGSRMLGSKIAHSKRDGTFEYQGMPDDDVYFGFMLKGYASRRHIPLKAGEENKVVLLPPTRVTVTVLDAETNEPIRNFSVDRGYIYSRGKQPESHMTWGSNKEGWMGYSEIKMGEAGRFENELNLTTPGYAYRISTEGYYAAESERVVMDGKAHELVVKLKKGTPLHLTITDAQGRPAAGAEVAFRTIVKDKYPWIKFIDGKYEDRGYRKDDESQKIGEDGTLTLPPTAERFRLMIGHPSGWANISSDDLVASKTIMLAPWERIKGKSFAGKKPNVGATVTYTSIGRYSLGRYGVHGEADNMTWKSIAVVDENGDFEIKYAVPKMGWVNDGTVTDRVYITPGDVSEIHLGGKGRPIIGKVVPPPESKEKDVPVWGGSIRLADVKFESSPKSQLGDDEWEMDTTGRRDDGLSEVDKDKNDLESYLWYQKTRQTYFRMNADGTTFRIENVLPGKYTIEVGGYVKGEQTVEVTLAEGQQYMEDPQEIPPIQLQDTEKCKVGSEAPDLVFIDVDGKAHRLSEYRGKHVLFYVWKAKYRYGREELAIFQALREKYRENGKLVILLLNSDEKPELVRRFIQEKNISGPYFFLKKESLSELDEDAPKSPAYACVWLVDPQGKILSKYLYEDEIEKALQQHLNTPAESK